MHFHQAAFINGRVVAFGPAELVLDPKLLEATYGGHVIVLPGRRADRHRRRPPPRRRAGRRAPLPRHANADVLNLILDPMAYGFMQRGLVAAVLVGDRLRGDGHVRRAQGPRVHRRRGEPRRVPGTRHRLPPRPAALPRRRGRRGRDGARDRLSSPVAAGSASIPRSASCSRGRSRSAILLFSTIKGYVADLLGYLLGNVLGITFADLVQIAFLGGVVLRRRRDPAQGAAVRHVRPGWRGRVRAAGRAASSTCCSGSSA